MSLKSLISPRVTARLTGEKRLLKRRQAAERKRKREGAMRTVDYFHEAGDPYSHLVAQILPEFCRRYELELRAHLVPQPPDWAAPDRERLIAYARKDAARLAGKAGLTFADPGSQPAPDRLDLAERALAASIRSASFLEDAADIGHWLWTGEGTPPQASEEATDLLGAGDTARDDLGHYLGATFHYEGEWYWGLDRLHYLDARLQEEGAVPDAQAPEFIFSPPRLLQQSPQAKLPPGAELHYYLSFRSPYTAISASRVKALADAYGAELKLRFVLPMVMRGMQVPRTKGRYILQDTAREARRLGEPFGKICDPVGEPVERGYAILPRAIEAGKGYAFAESFLKGVWAEGLDAGTDKDLRTITERAGLDWSSARDLIGGDHWQAEAEANRQEMMSLGLWGVPSFKFGDVAVWGQDRLWVIEDAMRRALETSQA